VTNDGRFGAWTYQLCFGASDLKNVLDNLSEVALV
jgi:hypothetical protein